MLEAAPTQHLLGQTFIVKAETCIVADQYVVPSRTVLQRLDFKNTFSIVPQEVRTLVEVTFNQSGPDEYVTGSGRIVATEIDAPGGETASTALILAAGTGHMGVAALLIAKGADVNARDASGATALTVASRAGHQALVELLRQHGGLE